MRAAAVPLQLSRPDVAIGFGLPKRSAPVDPNDQTVNYNTPLSTDLEAQFQAWAAQDPKRLNDLYDYDMRGFWKNGAQYADNGHGDDRFKKPNHPTFSHGSDYSGPMTQGGDLG